jgi:acetyl esterase
MRSLWHIGWVMTCLAITSHAAFAQAKNAASKYPPIFDDAKAHVYKSVGDVPLSLYVFSPEGHTATAKRPAIVFFFGGGWTNGSPTQFEQQCRYLASRGMVAITADYRVASRHKVKAVDCVRDAKSAIRWVRSHAGELGVDPDKIVASGGSAGGHLAACTATLQEFDEATEDRGVSSVPNATVLFNPAVSFNPAVQSDTKKQSPEELAARVGVAAERLSPAHHVRADLPPTLILIGTKDFLIDGNREFTAKMTKAGNRCELKLYEDQSHGFFNYGRGGNEYFRQTLKATDTFLASLGYLSGPPTVDRFFAK